VARDSEGQLDSDDVIVFLPALASSSVVAKNGDEGLSTLVGLRVTVSEVGALCIL